MADVANIHQALRRWHRRLKLTQSLTWLPRGLAAGLVVGLAILVAARLSPILLRQSQIALVISLAIAGIAAALVAVWVWPRDPLDLARLFDRRLGLKQRIITALEVDSGVVESPSPYLTEQLYATAIDTADNTDAKAAFPLRLDWREWALAAIPLGLVITLFYLPNPQDAILEEAAVIEQAVEDELVMLEALREEVLNDPTLDEAERAEIVQALDEAIETLSQPNVSQEEAVAALEAAEQELRQPKDELMADTLQQAANEFAEAGFDATAEALEEGDFNEAGESLEDLLNSDLTPEEAAELSGQLSALADSLAGTNPELSDALNDAADALAEGDVQAAQDALAEAGDAMAEAGEAGEAASAAAEQLGQAGEDIAQAGENGANQPGQGGMGQAQNQGQGQGQGQGNQGGTGAGSGEGSGETQPGQTGGQLGSNPPGDGGLEEYSEIYSPTRIGGEGGDQVDIPGDPDSGLPGAEGEFVDNPDGESNVDYSDVYADYEDQINEALESGYVPLGMRDLIQDYFSRLDPEEEDE